MAQRPGRPVQVDLSKEIPRLMALNTQCDARFALYEIIRILKAGEITGFNMQELLKGLTDAENAGDIEKTAKSSTDGTNLQICYSLTRESYSRFEKQRLVIKRVRIADRKTKSETGSKDDR